MRPLALTLALASTDLFLGAARAEFLITPVALQGQPAPGVPKGLTFQGGFRDGLLDANGQVLFVADLAGPDVSRTNQTGLWIGSSRDLQLAVRTGDPAPGYDTGVTFAYLGKPLILTTNAAGFYARLAGPGISPDAFEPGNDDTLWASYPQRTGLQPQSSGIDSVTRRARLFLRFAAVPYSTIQQVYLSAKLIQWINVTGNREAQFDSGLVVWFYAIVKRYASNRTRLTLGPTVNSGDELVEDPGFLQAFPDGSVTNLILTGDPAPGTVDRFQRLDPDSLSLSTSGTVAFAATTSSGAGIWYGAGGRVRPIALLRSPVPASLVAELGANSVWGSPSGPVGMNARGEVAFAASFASGQRIVAGLPERLRSAVATVPTTSTNRGFTSFGSYLLNGQGEMAVVGSHTDLRDIPGIAGIPGLGLSAVGLTSARGPASLVLAEGQSAPGLKAGEVVSFFGSAGSPFMNALGQVALFAEIGTAAGFEHRTDQGIWLADPVSGTHLVARGGTTVDIGAGQMRTLLPESISFGSTHDAFRSGGEDGRPSPFNDLGQLIFTAAWQEPNGQTRSGIFLASQVQMLPARKRGPDIALEFATLLGRKYRLESRDAIEGGAWSVWRDGIEGTGGIVTITDAGAANRLKRFYRVAMVP
ncbi:MAG: choice-of-anchor tandem repeat NxxGxxAF-containing protein [Verrucomicrobiota bacterium]